MTGRRQSARLASQNSASSPPQPQAQPKSSPAGRKRKNDANGSPPTAKRGKKDDEPKQQTLEETLNNHASEDAPPNAAEGVVDQQENSHIENGSAESNGDKSAQQNGEHETKEADDVQMQDANGEKDSTPATTQPKDDAKPEEKEPSQPKQEETQAQEPETQKDSKSRPSAESKPEHAEEQKPEASNGDAVVPNARGDDVPSSILEKGIIYFFFRARVNVDDPQDVKDIARTYMIMRPMPLDAKLGDGPIGDEGNCRLLALPKKVLPISGKDKFMTFVEKAKTSFKELKDSFMPGSDYATKTAGTSHSPPVTPLAEGVYAITTTGRESHLAYIITIPSELGEVQKDLGLKERGSFVTSVKNPTAPAPNNASLPQGPDYPKELLEGFRGLRWTPLEPKFLDYANAQFLIIGESYENAVEQRPKDEREGNGLPSEEIEKLEGEDEIRVKHLKGKPSLLICKQL
ncbi:hypothetical protein LTR84_011490 [Exophiala bonariae]|uniref:BTB domain transcription factor n=1 Tax=Exophiala bonariae TaxID=1690606 RepID=A0AAV9NG58_9EURO|nr:hypothetical protein LTR84_011490 [Exophiala bonariae]